MKFAREMTVGEMLKKYAGILMFIAILLFNVAITPNFVSIGTLRNIISQSCFVVLLAMGMLLVISSGGVDISIGSMIALGGTAALYLMDKGFRIVPSIAVALLCGALSGMIAGFFVGKLKISPMVTTLGLQIAVRGVAELLTNGGQVLTAGPDRNILEFWGTKVFLGKMVPIQIIPIILVVLLTYIITSKTMIGRHIQMVGDNSEACVLVGIRTAGVTLFVFVFSGVISALTGVLMSAKTGGCDPCASGLMMELDAIAAVAIGGTSLNGGPAKVAGTVLGAFTLQLITIMVNMNNVQYEYSLIVKAVIIVLAVLVQVNHKKA